VHAGAPPAAAGLRLRLSLFLLYASLCLFVRLICLLIRVVSQCFKQHATVQQGAEIERLQRWQPPPAERHSGTAEAQQLRRTGISLVSVRFQLIYVCI
jgi:hypothetical protein